MSKSRIVSYTSEEIKHLPSATDWKRLEAMTDEEIEAADTSDEGLGDNWMETAVLIHPTQKQRIYAAYDAYVVDYFKQQGRGYQTRMNAVLKAYVDAQLAKQAQQTGA